MTTTTGTTMTTRATGTSGTTGINGTIRTTETPGQLKQRRQQGQLVQPGQPGQLAGPGQPRSPVKMGQLGQLGSTGQQGQPEQLEQPGQLGQPGRLGQVGQARQLRQVGKLGQLDELGQLARPGQHGQPILQFNNLLTELISIWSLETCTYIRSQYMLAINLSHLSSIRFFHLANIIHLDPLPSRLLLGRLLYTGEIESNTYEKNFRGSNRRCIMGNVKVMYKYLLIFKIETYIELTPA